MVRTMDENTNYLVISLGFFLAIILLSALFIKPSDVLGKISIEEQPLQKVTELQVKPGERYLYEYKISEPEKLTTTLAYQIKKGNGCTILEVDQGTNKSGVCIDKYGNDESKSNVSLAKPFFYIFYPWMLAVNEDFNWQIYVFTHVPTKVPMSEVQFTTIKREQLFGRDAYKVLVMNKGRSSNQTISRWIDIEKRILLKEAGENYEVVLIEAPFPLNKT